MFDKSGGHGAQRIARQAVREQLDGRRFDALLHMQVSWRANLLSRVVDAPLRIGYDRARSKDLHGLFVNCRIPSRTGEHVLDAMAQLPRTARPQANRRALGHSDSAERSRVRFAAHPRADADAARQPIRRPDHRRRNWRPERYAAVMDHAALKHGWHVVLCGGPSAFEREFGDAILAKMHTRPLDLIGKDTLKQLLALLDRATLVLCPDSGPMHMANAVGAKMLGLHAASNPARSGPYSDRRWCVDRYDAAARKFRRKPAAALPWGTKLEYRDVMDLVEVDDAIERFEAFIVAGPSQDSGQPAAGHQ